MQNDALYLIQTDTTVGFLSRKSAPLTTAKQRPMHKPFLKVYADFNTFKANQHRVPNAFKARVRAAKTTTFIIKNQALRIVKERRHRDFLSRFGSMYSTSANQSGGNFNLSFATEQADVIVEDRHGFYQSTPSKIFKLGNQTLKRLR
jgi:tRNA A37 threonylcarbamoyladenosine synthetase subunit TsaC/SUA5/YrdC